MASLTQFEDLSDPQKLQEVLSDLKADAEIASDIFVTSEEDLVTAKKALGAAQVSAERARVAYIEMERNRQASKTAFELKRTRERDVIDELKNEREMAAERSEMIAKEARERVANCEKELFELMQRVARRERDSSANVTGKTDKTRVIGSNSNDDDDDDDDNDNICSRPMETTIRRVD